MEQEIRSSAPGWRKQLAEAYRAKLPFTFVDDGSVGLDLSGQTLFDVLKSSGLSARESIAVAMSLGVMGMGGKVLQFAARDPEPVTRTALAMLGGAMVLLPFGAAWKLLTGTPPGAVELAPGTMKITWA